MDKKMNTKNTPAEELEVLSAKRDNLIDEYNTGLEEDMELSKLRRIYNRIKEVKILIEEFGKRA